MKFQQEKEALEALEAIEAYIKERLTDARIKRSALTGELQKLEQSVKVLENRAQTIQQSKVHWVTPLPAIDETPKAPVSVEDTLGVVVSIFKSGTGKMRVKKVAEYAHMRGLLTSTNGLKGVIAMVNNAVLRNPKVFVSGGWGWWELAERIAIDSLKASNTAVMTTITPSPDNKADDDETSEQKPQAGTPVH